MQPELTLNPEQTVVIVGVGLIGGSVAAALRKRFPECRVIGIGRNCERMKQAADAGLLSDWSDSIAPDRIPAGSLGVVCLPINQIADAAKGLLDAGCDVVTDAGSVKAVICRELTGHQGRRFVAAHPIAGSEHSGFEFSDPNLFSGRICIVTPVESRPADVDRVESFWRSIGMTVYRMSPDHHDRVLALTSHLPHILASVAAGCVAPELLPFTGTGYRDTTRIAAGASGLWTSILAGNAKHCIDSIRVAELLLTRFRTALETNDQELLQSLWDESAERRRQLPQA